jgi:hypothetical protein
VAARLALANCHGLMARPFMNSARDVRPARTDAVRACPCAGGTNVPGTLLSVYTPAELILLALGGLLIAVGGALGPATWVARTRTTTALRAE